MKLKSGYYNLTFYKKYFTFIFNASAIFSEPEKVGFKRAAELTGVGFSAWARQVLRAAAILELEKVGETPAFLGK